MKTKTLNLGPVFITLAVLTFAGVHSTSAQSTAFTYQGRLQAGANPADGIYDLRFTIYDALADGNAAGATLTNSAIGVSNGLFSATLDFGGVFNGANYWLEIAVRTNGNGAFSTLSPRQPITPTPQALYAANAGSAATAGIAGSANSVSAANLTGTVADSQLSSNIVRLTIPNTTTQATGGVVITSGFVTSANVTNGGSGYTVAPTVTVGDVSGSNAVITATVAGGSVVSLTVQNAGNQYSAGATLTIAPPPSNAYQTFTSGNVFNGVNTFTNGSNSFVGAFNGTFGNFSGGTMTLSSNLNLPSTTVTAGIIYSGGSRMIHSFGTNNFFAGAGGGNLSLTGARNVGVGVNALRNDTSGNDNTANGYQALFSNTSGGANTANGYQTLFLNTSGGANTANGWRALWANTSGGNNTANGVAALGFNTTGYQNTANGFQALYSNTTGPNNTADGALALYANTTGGRNTANGVGALQNNTTGSKNTANGYQSLFSNTNGVSNVANGFEALYSNTSGNNNTANGDWALNLNTTGSNNTANGHQALNFNTTGRYNTADGDSALHNNTSGSFNAAHGVAALSNNTTGSYNTANGLDALIDNTTGSYNTANGVSALRRNTNGVSNIALGYQAGFNLTTGSSNIDIGNLGVAGDNNIIRIGTPGTHSNTFIAGIINGNGGVLTNVSAATLGGLATASFWKLGGNSGSNPGADFIGTTDNQPLELKVNGSRALRLEPNTNGAPNVIGGSPNNFAGAGVVGATISGGGVVNYFGFNFTNKVLADFGTVGGGNENISSGYAATVDGGQYNASCGSYATVGGGFQNTSSGGSATVGGGTNNTSSGYAAAVPGGTLNTATGDYSFAAGRRAKANHPGAFVWGDSSNADIASTNNNSWTVRASGGVRFFSNTNAAAGVILASNATSWASISDRNAKKNFQSVDSQDVLARLARVPITHWNYKWENDADVPHLGPMAQDFKAAFYPGRDDKTISTMEFDGVALVAIQGLNQKVEEQRAENAHLKQRLEQLERLMDQNNGGGK